MSAVAGSRPSTAGLFRAALPSLREGIAGSVIWAASMALTALVSLWLSGWDTPRSFLAIGLVFAAGGALAFPPALFLARLVSIGRRMEARFAAGLLSFAAGTLFLTTLVYATHHRLTFQEEHAPVLTIDWLAELAFTFAAAFYRFALFGAPLYFPLGLLFLFAVSLWHAHRPR